MGEWVTMTPCLVAGDDAVEVLVVVLVQRRHRPLVADPQVHLRRSHHSTSMTTPHMSSSSSRQQAVCLSVCLSAIG